MRELIAVLTFVGLLQCGRSNQISQTSAVGDVDTITQRSDGKFDIVCKDGRKEVATKADILLDKVCEPKNPIIIMPSGVYTVKSGAHQGSNCKHIVRPFYESEKLKRATVKSTGVCGAFGVPLSCAANKCTGSNGAGVKFRLETNSNTSYKFENLKTKQVSIFEFKEPELLLFQGVKKNVDEASLAGWRVCFKNTYDKYDADWTTVQNGCKGAKIMLGCRKVGSKSFKLLAMGDRKDVFGATNSRYSTRSHNGTGFYHYYYRTNRGSIGFAKQGDAVDLYYTDRKESPNGEERLSWYIYYGKLYNSGRCGNPYYIDSNQLKDWERVIFTSN